MSMSRKHNIDNRFVTSKDSDEENEITSLALNLKSLILANVNVPRM